MKTILSPLVTLVFVATLAGCAAQPVSGPTPSAPETTASTPVAHLSLQQRMVAAIETGNVASARAVLEEGLSPEAPLGGTAADPQLPIHRAAGADQVEIVALLIDTGAGLDIACGGLTPLMLATLSGGVDSVRLLLDAGADPTLSNFKYFGVTAWHYAGRDGNVAALQAFLDAGGDIDSVDTTNGTAISWAAGYGQAEAVEFLISHGADVNIRHSLGTTPLGWAVGNGFPEIAEMIAATGGVL